MYGGAVDEFSGIAREASERAAAAASEADLDEVHTAFLGRKGGRLPKLMAGLANIPKAERADFGRRANEAKGAIEAAIAAARARIEDRAIDAALARRYDVTFGGTAPRTGSLHLLRQTLDDVVDFFRSRGFAIVLGPELETDYFNFEALNIGPDHPARDSMDTFYLPSGALLRPHTSPMQIRAMLQYPPPIAILVPGKAYRRDALDARHSFMFHQIEGLHIDRGVTFGHLKAFAGDLCRHLFGKTRRTRFRPSYFPFTEPSAEVDVSCGVCDGRGCQTCGKSGWLELGGAGMVHPNVLRNVKYDPEEFTGWAWGFGLERIALVRNAVDDIRVFTENDLGFLEQFA
jgi:phenylalanyl-tRNA synthetase alpha chain